jgi:hypothetical protein
MRATIVKALKPSPRISYCRAALHAQLGGSKPYTVQSIPKSHPVRAAAAAAVERSSLVSSSAHPQPPEHDADDVTDQEWELRTGESLARVIPGSALTKS